MKYILKDIIIISILFILILCYYFSIKERLEGFYNMELIPDKTEKIYDKFYSKIYDKLFYSDSKINFEITQIKNNTFKMSESKMKILDIGCGTGQHIYHLKNYNIIGLDQSNDMLQIARKKSPKVKFIKDNMNNSNIFDNNRFSHIMVLYFVIYYQNDLNKFLSNCYKWLDKNKYLIIHLVHPKKFDPILDPASPFPGFSLQKYSKKRITKSSVYFNNFIYESNFNLHSDKTALFTETFKFKNKKKILLSYIDILVPSGL